jgi:hypothetical protein
MTANEIAYWAGRSDDAAQTRVIEAQAAAEVFAARFCIAVQSQPGKIYTRPATRAEQYAAVHVATELAIIAEGGLRVLGRV